MMKSRPSERKHAWSRMMCRVRIFSLRVHCSCFRGVTSPRSDAAIEARTSTQAISSNGKITPSSGEDCTPCCLLPARPHSQNGGRRDTTSGATCQPCLLRDHEILLYAPQSVYLSLHSMSILPAHRKLSAHAHGLALASSR